MDFKRHNLIWLKGDDIPYVITRQAKTIQDELIVARSYAGIKNKNSRQASIVKLKDIDKHQRPYSLKKILHSSMSSIITNYKRSLLKILAYYKLYGIKIYVYGSTSWQYITSTPYLNENSDIDLLIEVGNINKLHLIPNLINDLSILIKLRLDGELLIIKDSLYIAINEWLNVDTHEQLLVKTDNHVYLSSKMDIIHSE